MRCGPLLSVRFHVVLFAVTSVRSVLFACALVHRVSLCLTPQLTLALSDQRGWRRSAAQVIGSLAAGW